VYVDFTSKVADGRRMPKERVLEIAKGRIWSGEDGKALGLVDELGGFPEALALAKKAAKIPAGEDVSVQLFPRKKSGLQTFMDTISGDTPESSDQDAEATAVVRALRMVQPLARQVRAATGQTGVLEMPAVQGRP
jgi:protease-4